MTRSKLAPLVFALSAALPAGVAAQSGGAASEEDAVRTAVDHYFALLRSDGEWRVITKIFHRGPASASEAPGG